MLSVAFNVTAEEERAIIWQTHPGMLHVGWTITQEAETQRWQAWTSGHPVGVARDEANEAIAAIAPASSHGYSVTYYAEDQNGEVFHGPTCASCVRAVIFEAIEKAQNSGSAWMAFADIGFYAEALDNDTPYFGNIVCEDCGEVIEEWRCAECGNEVMDDHYRDGLPILRNNDGIGLHGKCIAPMVVMGMASKTGKQNYVVGKNRWYDGCFEVVPTP